LTSTTQDVNNEIESSLNHKSPSSNGANISYASPPLRINAKCSEISAPSCRVTPYNGHAHAHTVGSCTVWVVSNRKPLRYAYMMHISNNRRTFSLRDRPVGNYVFSVPIPTPNYITDGARGANQAPSAWQRTTAVVIFSRAVRC